MVVLFDFTPAKRVSGALTGLLSFVDTLSRKREFRTKLGLIVAVDERVRPFLENYTAERFGSKDSITRFLFFKKGDGILGKIKWFKTIEKFYNQGTIDFVFFPNLGLLPRKIEFRFGGILRQALYFYNFQQLPLKLRMGLSYVNSLYKKQLKNAEIIFVQTKWMRQQVIDHYGVDERKIKVVTWNVVNHHVNVSKLIEERYMKISNGKGLKFLYVARPHPYKNFENLFMAFAILLDRSVRNLTLTVTFNEKVDKYAKHLISTTRELGIHQYVNFVGLKPRNEVFKLYMEHDVLVFPSLCESFGVPLVEAMSFGLPVVVSDLEYAREVCREASLYFNPHDPEDIADKMISLLDKENWYRFSNKSYDCYRRSYMFHNPWEEVLEELSKILF